MSITLSHVFIPHSLLLSISASSVVKLRGNRSQLDRAGVYLKRGFGTYRDKEERIVTDTRKKRSSLRDRDSDEDIYEMRKRNDSEKSDRKVEMKESRREVTIDSNSEWKIPERDRDRDREREDKDRKDDFVSVAVTVPCPASRAGCLIGSKGEKKQKEI